MTTPAKYQAKYISRHTIMARHRWESPEYRIQLNQCAIQKVSADADKLAVYVAAGDDDHLRVTTPHRAPDAWVYGVYDSGEREMRFHVGTPPIEAVGWGDGDVVVVEETDLPETIAIRRVERGGAEADD